MAAAGKMTSVLSLIQLIYFRDSVETPQYFLANQQNLPYPHSIKRRNKSLKLSIKNQKLKYVPYNIQARRSQGL